MARGLVLISLIFFVCLVAGCGGSGGNGNSVSIAVNPLSVTRSPGGIANFTATVAGGDSTAVEWDVVEPSGGSVTSTGVYTAPGEIGTYHIRARYIPDASKTATATVTVRDGVVVVIDPETITLSPGDSTQFSAMVTGTSYSAVTWSVEEGSDGGSVTDSGLYTAPSADGIYHVVATSSADPSISAVAAVEVNDGIIVTISPDDTSCAPGSIIQFTAVVTGTSNTAVTWSIQEGSAGGTITQKGAYSAPDRTGTYHIVATSEANNAKKATALVTVDTALLGPVRQLQAGDEWQYEVTGQAEKSSGTTALYDVTGSYVLNVSGETIPTPQGETAKVVLESASLTIPGSEIQIRAYANTLYVTQDSDRTIWIHGGKKDGVQYWISSPAAGCYKYVASPMVPGDWWSASVTQTNGIAFDMLKVVGNTATVSTAAGAFETYTVTGNGLFAGMPAVIEDWWCPSLGAQAQRELTFTDSAAELRFKLTLELKSRNR